MKARELKLEELKKVLKCSVADGVHIYIPFDDLIAKVVKHKTHTQYYLLDKHAPADPSSRFIRGRDYLSLSVFNDLSWIACSTFAATNHLAAINKVLSFVNTEKF